MDEKGSKYNSWMMTEETLYTRNGGGCIHDLACRSNITVDLASPQNRGGARQIFAGPTFRG